MALDNIVKAWALRFIADDFDRLRRLWTDLAGYPDIPWASVDQLAAWVGRSLGHYGLMLLDDADRPHTQPAENPFWTNRYTPNDGRPI